MISIAGAAAAAPQAAVRPPRGRTRSELLPRRPYPGLRPFEKAEWPIFRGRDRLIQDVLTILAQRHFASVIGPSGSGKSSLVRAGVLAALERRHGRLGVRWRTATMRPGVSPLWSMADALLRSLRPEPIAADGEVPAAEVARLRVQIDASEDGLAGLTRGLDLKEHENVLLLVDQFEEIFRYRSDGEDRERARLVELLVEVARERPPGFYVVTTMRSEYLGDCARFGGLAETLNETHYLLPRMSDAELRQAIIEPPGIKGGSIETALVDRLIDDIKGQEDQLPILQHTLLWMWIQEEERREREGCDGSAGIELGLAAYEQLEAGRNAGGAGVKNALSRHGDRILDGLSAEERRVAAVMFRRLVEVEEHSSRLRRPTQCGTVARLAQVPLEVVQRVVDAFRAVDASFIHASRPNVTDDTSIDIMHESLIRQWGTLDGWVRREAASYEVYHDLCRAAQRMADGEGTLLAGLALSRALNWLYEEEPTRLWARRYGGDFDAAISFLTASDEVEEQRRLEATAAEEAARLQEKQALRDRLEEQTRLARERRRFTRFAGFAAVVLGMLATVAGLAFLQASKAEIAAKAGSFWYRLQLFGDPIKPEGVDALWDLAQQDEAVRIEFVRQLAGDPALLSRFGVKPQPIARAVGLRWPAPARGIGEEIVSRVARDDLKPDDRDMFALVTYARAVAVLAPRLEEPLAKAAIGKIAQAINGLAGQDSLSDRELRALAEIVGVFSDRIGSEMIRPVRERLRKEIPTPGDASERRGRALGRAIEVMVADLSPSQRVEAARSISGQLAQNLDAWNPTAIPRTLEVLLTALDGGAPPDVLSGLPSAMAAAAVARADADSAYLLALMQVVESLATLPDESLAASFGQQLFAQLSRPNDPLQQAALVRAAIPLLERQDEHAKALIPMIASNTVLPEAWDSTADPAHEARLRRYAQDALRRAVEAPQGPARRFAAERVWRHLQQRWAEAPRPDARRNPYRQAAQARLLAMLGPSLAKDSAAFATVDLLAMLSRTSNHQSREAIARALTGLASRLPASERADSLAAAKAMLANTGSSEEARAWTIAIVALLPEDATAATAEIVQALKYPTATGAPTDILLAAARKLWPDGNEIAGRTLPDADVVDWLQGHLPRGVDTDEPTDRPAALHSATDQLEG